MAVKKTLAKMCLAGLLLVQAVAPAPALATTVTPVMIDLQSNGRGVVANISVNNTGATAMPMEISLQALVPTGSGLVAGKGSTDDLLVVPPSALIPAGQTQTFRVQWVGDPELAASKHYYVAVNQLPVKLPEGTSAVQVVYNFQVLVSVASPDMKPALVIKSVEFAELDGKPAAAITVENKAQAHGYLSQHRLKISQSDASGAETFSKTISGSEFQQLVGYGLVASNQVRRIVVPVALPSRSGKLSAVLLDERAQ